MKLTITGAFRDRGVTTVDLLEQNEIRRMGKTEKTRLVSEKTGVDAGALREKLEIDEASGLFMVWGGRKRGEFACGGESEQRMSERERNWGGSWGRGRGAM